MKALALSSVFALGLLLAGPALADTPVFNSKTTQNISYAPSSGGSFDGTYLSSKGGSGLTGPTQEEAGKTSRVALCSRHSQMNTATCNMHCNLASN